MEFRGARMNKQINDVQEEQVKSMLMEITIGICNWINEMKEYDTYRCQNIDVGKELI